MAGTAEIGGNGLYYELSMHETNVFFFPWGVVSARRLLVDLFREDETSDGGTASKAQCFDSKAGISLGSQSNEEPARFLEMFCKFLVDALVGLHICSSD
jgi:hypothetical protein